jgi:vitamin B12 transporter
MSRSLRGPRVSGRKNKVLPMKGIWPLVFTLVSIPSLVAAQDKLENIETVVVTATRTTRTLDQLAAPVILIDRSTIERSMARDVADLLKFHAGLDVARNGGPGQPTSVFMRGSESNHTLVMIDGVKINPGTAGGAALQQLSPELIERIEIVKGPRSSLYGSEAIGGVINVITRGQSGQDGVTGSMGGGSYATRDASVEGRISGSAGVLAGGASWVTTDGFPVLTDSTLDRGHDNRSITIFGSTRLAATTISARHWATEGNTEYLDFLLAPLDQDFRNQVTSLELDAAPNTSWQTSVAVSNTIDEVRQNQSEDFFITDRNALDWQNNFQLNEHLLTAGAYLSAEDTRAMTWGSGYDVSTSVNAIYLQDQFTVDNHDLVAAVRYTDHETAGAHSTWNLDYAYNLSPRLRLTAGLGTGFRAPDSSERFGYGGNIDLQPETSANVELGASFRPDPGQELWLRAFNNDIDNLIEFVIVDFNTFEGINRNVARARVRGLEAGYEYRSGDWLFRAEAIAQDPRDHDTDAQLLRRARQTLTSSLVRSFGRHEVGIDLLASGERKDFGFPEPISLPGYALINLNGRLALGNNWWLAAKMENLMDRDYQTVAGYTSPGRGVYLSISYRSF